MCLSGFIWTQNWDSWHGAHKLDNSLGRWWCFFIVILFSFVEAVYLCNMEILFCACYSLTHMCSWAVLDNFSPLTSLVLITPKKSVFVQKPLYFNLLMYFASSCAIHCLFFCGGCLFCWISGVTVFPEGCFRQPSKPWRSGKVLTEEYLEPWLRTMQGIRDQNYVDDVDVFCTGKCVSQ